MLSLKKELNFEHVVSTSSTSMSTTVTIPFAPPSFHTGIYNYVMGVIDISFIIKLETVIIESESRKFMVKFTPGSGWTYASATETVPLRSDGFGTYFPSSPNSTTLTVSGTDVNTLTLTYTGTFNTTRANHSVYTFCSGNFYQA